MDAPFLKVKQPQKGNNLRGYTKKMLSSDPLRIRRKPDPPSERHRPGRPDRSFHGRDICPAGLPRSMIPSIPCHRLATPQTLIWTGQLLEGDPQMTEFQSDCLALAPRSRRGVNMEIVTAAETNIVGFLGGIVCSTTNYKKKLQKWDSSTPPLPAWKVNFGVSAIV